MFRPKVQGELAELKFMYEAYRLGLVISKPYGDNQKYDFITDHNGVLNRVQVKSVGVKNKNRCYVGHMQHGHDSKLKYETGDYDIAAILIIPEEVWYIIPSDKISSTKIRLFCNCEIKHTHKSLTGKFECYINRWELLGFRA